MIHSHPFLNFNVSARSFLARAVEHIAAYEKEEGVEHFLHAALHLRFGIEARLNEYLKPALKSVGQHQKASSDYVASVLLKKLLSIDPDAGIASNLEVTNQQSGRKAIMQFVPVSKRLASIHGRLGELLHFKLFTNNQHWMIRKPLGGSPDSSIADYLPLLKEGVEELRAATSGLLLSHPKFTLLVEEVVKEIDDEELT